MYAKIPYKSSWLIEMLQAGFDVVKTDEKTITFWGDYSLLIAIDFEQKGEKEFTFDLSKSIVLYDFVEEWAVNELKKRQDVFVEKLEHPYMLTKKGELEDDGTYTIEMTEYRATVHLAEESKEAFLKESVLQFLPNLRLKEVTGG